MDKKNQTEVDTKYHRALVLYVEKPKPKKVLIRKEGLELFLLDVKTFFIFIKIIIVVFLKIFTYILKKAPLIFFLPIVLLHRIFIYYFKNWKKEKEKFNEKNYLIKFLYQIKEFILKFFLQTFDRFDLSFLKNNFFKCLDYFLPNKQSFLRIKIIDSLNILKLIFVWFLIDSFSNSFIVIISLISFFQYVIYLTYKKIYRAYLWIYYTITIVHEKIGFKSLITTSLLALFNLSIEHSLNFYFNTVYGWKILYWYFRKLIAGIPYQVYFKKGLFYHLIKFFFFLKYFNTVLKVPKYFVIDRQLYFSIRKIYFNFIVKTFGILCILFPISFYILNYYLETKIANNDFLFFYGPTYVFFNYYKIFVLTFVIAFSFLILLVLLFYFLHFLNYLYYYYLIIKNKLKYKK